ncbi:2Fe-2S iron-sulfur cluster-binding protein [Zavarzinia sp.]|uniref:2Fe-2S iron-sulfur cluster-binding protein n=1 Tax=Zavarzinia sp. TaxID=2027920 RepID=UPI00356252CC
MSFTVTLPEFGVDIEVPRGRTVLDAALDEGLDYPFFCRGGTCGTCKSRLVSGEVELKAYAGFALTPAERASGLILACRALPQTDCEIVTCDAEAR